MDFNKFIDNDNRKIEVELKKIISINKDLKEEKENNIKNREIKRNCL